MNKSFLKTGQNSIFLNFSKAGEGSRSVKYRRAIIGQIY